MARFPKGKVTGEQALTPENSPAPPEDSGPEVAALGSKGLVVSVQGDKEEDLIEDFSCFLYICILLLY